MGEAFPPLPEPLASPTSQTARPELTFRARSGGSYQPWVVVGYTAEEAINELPRYTADLAMPLSAPYAAAAPEEALTGVDASLYLEDALAGRWVHGIIAEATHLGYFPRDEGDWALVRVVLVPRAWLLTRRRTSRVFQQAYPHQIAAAVLAGYGDVMRVEWRLTKSYPRRRYCVQYDETDWDFVTRILAEEGILFFFRHTLDFAAQKAPEVEGPDNSFGKLLKGIRGGATLFGNTVGKATKKSAFGDYTRLAVGSIQAVTDLLSPADEDDEAPLPTTFPRASIGLGGPTEVIVLTDAAGGYEPYLGDDAQGVVTVAAIAAAAITGEEAVVDAPHPHVSLTLRDKRSEAKADGEVENARALDYAETRRVTSDALRLRDYDFRRPLLLNENLAPKSADPASLEVYEHRGQYEVPEVDDRLADIKLAQRTVAQRVRAGRSLAAGLAAGGKMTLTDLRRGAPVDHPLVVTRVRHRYQRPEFAEAHAEERPPFAPRPGDPAAAYFNEFEAAPDDVAFHPPSPERRIFNVTETATVVGPRAADLHVDRFGRIRIRFHWDRDEGRWDDTASCWVRVAQTWAGAGWGTQFIPRVGMEVLVTFLHGDPDRPVVTGCLYNGTHPTPEPLPERASRSGIRTQSVPVGGGFNELSFEDAKGTERVYLRAERDLDLLVRNSRTATVLRDDTLTAGNDLLSSAGRDRVDATSRDAVQLAGRHGVSSTARDRVSRVGRSAVEQVEGDASESARGVRVVESRRDEVRTVAGDLNVVVQGSQITAVGSAAKPSSSVTFVNGDLHLSATGQLVIRADPGKKGDGKKGDGEKGGGGGLRMECGDSVLELTKDAFRVRAKRVELIADEKAEVRVGPTGKRDTQLLMKSTFATLRSESVSLISAKGDYVRVGDGSAQVQGTRAIELMSPRTNHSAMTTPKPVPELKETSETAPKPNVQLALCHGWRETKPKPGEAPKPTPGEAPKPVEARKGTPLPLAGVRFRAVAGGHVTEGVTDGAGVAALYAPPEAKTVQLTAYAHEKFAERFPEDAGPLVWVVHLVDALEGAEKPAGARARLRDLGYDASTDLAAPADPDNPKRLDAQSREALRDFQRAVGLKPTGLLDDPTRAALKERHGG